VKGLPVITDPRVERYMLDLVRYSKQSGLPDGVAEVLADMQEFAERMRFPIVGPLLGRYLCLTAGMVGAQRILDAGAGFGYSAAWLAAGAGAGAAVTCIDNSEQNLIRGREFHRRMGLGSRFVYRHGEAVDLLTQDVGPFDIVFNDIDKERYPQFAQVAVERLRPGGVYLANSVLWYGKVCISGNTWDAWTSAVHQHNDWVFNRPDLFVTINDQCDGLLVAVKRG